MFSLFPNLLVFEGFAPLLLRLTLGTIFLFWGYRKLKNRADSNNIFVGGLDCAVGTLLILGLFTQLAALVAVIMLAIGIYKKVQRKAFLTDGVNYYLILLVI